MEGASESDQPVGGRGPLLAVLGREYALVVDRPDMLWAGLTQTNL